MKLRICAEDGYAMDLAGEGLRWEVTSAGHLEILDGVGTLATFAAGMWRYVFVVLPSA